MRKFENPEITRHMSDDIESEVVNAMIEAVTENFDIAHERYKIKTKLLGQKQMKYHERSVEI